MRSLALALALVGACAKDEPKQQHVSPLPATEIQRARDACGAYVDAACKCAGSAGSAACALAKPLPDALEMAIQMAANPGEQTTTQQRAIVLVRETVKSCVEELAKLPSLGCR